MADLPEFLEIVTKEPVEYSIIWLHGLGADGNDFTPVVPELKLDHLPGIRFIFPHAPVRPITINGGMPMRGWYDIDSLDFDDRQHDREGIHASKALISTVIDCEINRGIDASRIILAGFSQGGAIALFTGLTSEHQLGGIMALSTYLPLSDELATSLEKSPPILMIHGKMDEVINIQYAETSRQHLISKGATVQWETYPMGHGLCQEEISVIAAWISARLGS